jgi:polar amino acid transport system substrate-binding protein
MDRRRDTNIPVLVAVISLVVSIATAGWVAIHPGGNTSSITAIRPGLIEDIRRDKVIRAGYVLNPPQAQRDPANGDLSGYHIELLREIARQANCRVEFEETTFANMSLALRARSRIVVGGGFVSVDRATSLAFTKPLFHLGLGYVCRKDDKRFQTEADLQRSGIKVAYAVGSASEEYVKANLPDAEPVALARGELAKVALEVMSGRADAGIVNQAQCFQFARDQPSLSYPTQGKPFHRFASSFTLPQGDTDGLVFFNTAIETLRTNGFLDKLERKYNPDGLFWTPIRP